VSEKRRVRASKKSDRAPRAKKRYGQHFLEAAWAERLVNVIAPAQDERFLEIGPGPGALTLRLAPRVRHLTAVEVDPAMIAALTPRLPPNATIVAGDFLDFDFASLDTANGIRVAGNLPYNAASHIILKLLSGRRQGIALTDATLMIQREVAERIEAAPGSRDYGTLSIFVQLRASVTRLLTLPPGAFRPMPMVHSAVIRLTFRDPVIAMRDEATLEALVRSIFTQRRKTLANALRRFADAHGTTAREALAQSALDGTRRPETLQLTELARLADVFPSHP
jgi:16S rRNA (adenine1518-N6/adenine1519-N6)-dimethyltransferase